MIFSNMSWYPPGTSKERKDRSENVQIVIQVIHGDEFSEMFITWLVAYNDLDNKVQIFHDGLIRFKESGSLYDSKPVKNIAFSKN